jgi:hypothetical protein
MLTLILQMDSNNIDSTPIVALILMLSIAIMFAAGLMSSVKLVRRLEDEEDHKNRP